MSGKYGDILADICQTLRSCGDFSAVTIGPDDDSVHMPRAEIILKSVDETPSQDTPLGRWLTMTAAIRIYVRSHDSVDAFTRATELAESAAEALLEDRFRGQNCRDLATGKATSIGPLKVEPSVKQPNLAVTFEVRCNFEAGGTQ